MTVNHDVLSSILRVTANNVGVAQLVERKVVALVAVGANPTPHPNKM